MPTPSPAPPVEPSPLRVRVQTVLLVDDEDDILRSIDTLLTTSLPNLRCLLARNGPEALRLLEREKVDLILSDYKMPGMDGLQFLERAKALAPRVPRMLLTAFPDLEVAMNAINDASVETFLTKPLDPQRLTRAVQASLAKRRAKEGRDQAIGRALSVRRSGGA